jgi:excinuclease ABC subunit B
VPRYTVFPKTHYVTPREVMLNAVEQIKDELRERLEWLRDNDKLVEAQRLEQRTIFDLEMMVEVGYCSGIENYSRYLSGPRPRRAAADPVRLPAGQRAAGHRREPRHRPPARRHVPRRPLAQGEPGGIRLPAALGAGQPAHALRGVRGQAAPGDLRLRHAAGPYEQALRRQVVEQVVRPTGLVDPEVEVRPA